jgi:hypothetical protein
MNIYLRLAGNTILGVLVSSFIYGVFVYLASTGGGTALLGIAFLVVLPLSLLCGSYLTGYLSFDKLKGFKSIILISPGLYLFLLFNLNNLLFADIGFAISMIVPATIWLIASVAGAYLGVRKRKQKK